MLPSFIGIGAPKAATTWLFRCLQEHPDVYMAPVKETKFFDDEHIEGRMGEYEAHFVGAGCAKAVGEISVRYLASQRGAAERIRKCLPDVRLFVSLRNPIDQVYSHYWHLQRQNFHHAYNSHLPLSFEQSLERFPQELLGPASYGTQLETWLAHFDRQQLLVLFYDEICADPAAVVQQLYDFLGVDATFVPVSLHQKGIDVRTGTSPIGRWAERLHARVYDGLCRIVYSPLKKAIGSWAAEKVKNSLHVRQAMEKLFRRPGYPPMRQATRHHLQCLFDQEIRKVERLTGCELSRWRQPASD